MREEGKEKEKGGGVEGEGEQQTTGTSTETRATEKTELARNRANLACAPKLGRIFSARTEIGASFRTVFASA